VTVPWLTLTWLVPAVAGALLPRSGRAALAIATATHLFGLVVAIALFLRMVGVLPGVTPSEALGFGGGLRYHASADGLVVVFLALVSLVGQLVTLFGPRAHRGDLPAWLGAVAWMQASITGMLVSTDLLQFALFFGAEVVPCTLLLSRYGVTAERGWVARRVGVFLGLGAALFAGGALFLGQAHLAATGSWSTAPADIAALALPPETAQLAMALLLVGLVVRAPLFPFHGWLPLSLEHGPVVGLNVFLLGVKVAVVAVVRLLLPALPGAAADLAPVVTALGAASLVYGTLMAVTQTRLRRLLAFLALAHMGAILPALFSGTPHSVQGAVLEALNLGVAAAGLNFAVGFLHVRAGSSDFEALRRVGPSMPRLAAAFFVVALASVGMPGTLGFDALHLVLEGALEDGRYGTAALLAVGTVASAAALLLAFQRIFLADTPRESAPADLGPSEILTVGLLCALVLTGPPDRHPLLHLMARAVHASEAP
jgi:NADH-quinone oxidoreductase subunit M